MVKHKRKSSKAKSRSRCGRGHDGYITIDFEVYKKKYIDKVMKEWQDRWIIA